MKKTLLASILAIILVMSASVALASLTPVDLQAKFKESREKYHQRHKKQEQLMKKIRSDRKKHREEMSARVKKMRTDFRKKHPAPHNPKFKIMKPMGRQ
jgi:uncharacterized protein YxeA